MDEGARHLPALALSEKGLNSFSPRYKERPIGNSPEVMPWDCFLNKDIKDQIKRHVAFPSCPTPTSANSPRRRRPRSTRRSRSSSTQHIRSVMASLAVAASYKTSHDAWARTCSASSQLGALSSKASGIETVGADIGLGSVVAYVCAVSPTGLVGCMKTLLRGTVSSLRNRNRSGIKRHQSVAIKNRIVSRVRVCAFLLKLRIEVLVGDCSTPDVRYEYRYCTCTRTSYIKCGTKV